MSGCEDVEICRDDLSKYFVETVDNSNYSNGETSWSYYINPPIGLSVKILTSEGEDVLISYGCQCINKIMITESAVDEYHGSIFLFDENEEWVEDIYISLNSGWDNVFFVFDKVDLNYSSTLNEGIQAVFQLYDGLNPYNVDEFKGVLRDWLENNPL